MYTQTCGHSVSNFLEEIILNVPQSLDFLYEQLLLQLPESPLIVVTERDISK